MLMKTLIYDCEIINCIPPKYGDPNPAFKYCQGWSDWEGMGIAVIGTYASWRLPMCRYQAFTNERLEEFQRLVNQAERVVGFNSLSFDDNLCRANGIEIKTDYDLLAEIRGSCLYATILC